VVKEERVWAKRLRGLEAKRLEAEALRDLKANRLKC
jgi:hypothetical protein